MTVPLTNEDLWAVSEDLPKGICENPQTSRGIPRTTGMAAGVDAVIKREF